MAKKWIQKAIHPERKGVLRAEFGVKEGETIPTSKLTAKIRRLHKKAEGGKKLSKDELKNLRRVNLAKTLKKLPRRGK